MWRVLNWILQFVAFWLVIMAALLAYDFYKHGMTYAGSPLFDYDVNYDQRIALAGAIILFLVDVCYRVTHKALRMGKGPNRGDVN